MKGVVLVHDFRTVILSPCLDNRRTAGAPHNHSRVALNRASSEIIIFPFVGNFSVTFKLLFLFALG